MTGKLKHGKLAQSKNRAPGKPEARFAFQGDVMAQCNMTLCIRFRPWFNVMRRCGLPGALVIWLGMKVLPHRAIWTAHLVPAPDGMV